MFYKSILLAFTLFILTVAHPAQQTGKTNIKLNRRSAPTTEDGFIDQDKLLVQLNRTISKHQQNEINRQRNAQTQANSSELNLSQSAAIKIASSPNHPSSAIHARQLPTEPISFVDGRDAGIIWIGTKHQQLTVDFETTSADLWVMSPSCTSSACNGQPKYDPNQSPSVAFQNANFSLTYVNDAQVTGFLVTDVVILAGVAAWGQWLACATDASADVGTSGAIGLGYPLLSSISQTPYFNNAINQGAVQKAEFAMKLAEPNPVLTLGGNDPSLYNGKPEFHPVQTESGYWKIGGAVLFMGSNPLITGFNTAFDSASAVSAIPSSAAQQIYSQIPGAQPSGGGLYSFPCDAAIPSISISWANKQQWTLPPSSIILGTLSNGQCQGSLVGIDLNLGDPDFWFLGATIMEAFYLVFSFETNDVGIASLK